MTVNPRKIRWTEHPAMDGTYIAETKSGSFLSTVRVSSTTGSWIQHGEDGMIAQVERDHAIVQLLAFTAGGRIISRKDETDE